MKIDLEIDLNGKVNSLEVIREFNKLLKFTENEILNSSWDSFDEYMSDLSEELSSISGQNEIISHFHLLIKNVIDFKKCEPKGFDSFMCVLGSLTDPTFPSSRYDKINFSFTVRNED